MSDHPPMVEVEQPEDQVANFRRHHFEDISPLCVPEVVFGIAAILAWLVVLCAGILVSTQFYRETILNPQDVSFGQLAKSWVLVLSCYTIPNVAWLSCLAAVVGEFAGRSRDHVLRLTASQRAEGTPSTRDVMAYYASTSARGFVIYLLAFSGLLILTTEAIVSPTQDQYVRLASSISVVSFLVGYDSRVFKNAMDRIVEIISFRPPPPKARV